MSVSRAHERFGIAGTDPELADEVARVLADALAGEQTPAAVESAVAA